MSWKTTIRDLWFGCTWLDLRSGDPLETGVWTFTLNGASRDALKVQEKDGRGVAFVAIPNADLQEFLDAWGKPNGSKLGPEEIRAAAELEPGQSLTLSTGVTIRRTEKP